MKKLLILHSWGATPSDNWYSYLQNEAEHNGYEVHLPQLDNKDNPTLTDWTNSALQNFKLDEDTSIIGHSLGAVLALKLAENSPVIIDKLILVSGWDFWDLTPEHKTFFANPINHVKIITNSKKRVVVHSTNDPYITIYQAGEMATRLKADLIKIENGGHLLARDGYTEFPQLMKLLV